MAQGMEADGGVHWLTAAMCLGAMSPYFGADLVAEVNGGGMSWDEVILACYLFVFAAGDM